MFPPPLPPQPYPSSPVRATWVAASDVEPEPLAPDPVRGLVELVRGRRLTEVFLETPELAWQVPAEVARACRELRARRTYVAALGGRRDWLVEPALLPVRWVRAALAAAPFHRLHLDLAPWEMPAWREDQGRLWSSYLTVLDSVRRAARGIPLDVDVPWWFATQADTSGAPLLAAVLDRVQRVTLLVDASRSDGPLGILARVAPGAQLCDARGQGFWVGVTAGEPEEGPSVFWSDAALEREAAAVRATLRRSTGYRGFAVRDYRSWRRLLVEARLPIRTVTASAPSAALT